MRWVKVRDWEGRFASVIVSSTPDGRFRVQGVGAAPVHVARCHLACTLERHGVSDADIWHVLDVMDGEVAS